VSLCSSTDFPKTFKPVIKTAFDLLKTVFEALKLTFNLLKRAFRVVFRTEINAIYIIPHMYME